MAKKPKTSVLVLEDDPLHRSLLAEGLEAYYDYDVIRAASLQEAEEGLRQVSPDLLLLDCVLGGNRFQVVDWVRGLRQGRLATVPILFVTAYFSEMEEEVRGIEHSAILAKPFTFDDVTAKMRALLKASATD